jgi:hypothetical protein
VAGSSQLAAPQVGELRGKLAMSKVMAAGPSIVLM